MFFRFTYEVPGQPFRYQLPIRDNTSKTRLLQFWFGEESDATDFPRTLQTRQYPLS